jgi:hypothetical protein
MAKLTDTILLMERIDKLIRRKATGTPQEMAERLNISKASLYRILEVMKEFGAPIDYCSSEGSYVYSHDVNFYCGFYSNVLAEKEQSTINGGFIQLSILTNINNINNVSLKK